MCKSKSTLLSNQGLVNGFTQSFTRFFMSYVTQTFPFYGSYSIGTGKSFSNSFEKEFETTTTFKDYQTVWVPLSKTADYVSRYNFNYLGQNSVVNGVQCQLWGLKTPVEATTTTYVTSYKVNAWISQSTLFTITCKASYSAFYSNSGTTFAPYFGPSKLYNSKSTVNSSGRLSLSFKSGNQAYFFNSCYVTMHPANARFSVASTTLSATIV